MRLVSLSLDPVSEYDIQAKRHENLYRGADNNIIQTQFVANNSNSSRTRTFYHYDALGSVVGRTNSTGSSDKTYRYESFGSDYSNNPTTTGSIYNLGFTGEEFNEQAGVYEFYSRSYDPTTGTWLQRDTYRGEIEVPQSLHGYSYVMNSPVMYADAYGFYKKCNYFDPVCNAQNSWELTTNVVTNLDEPEKIISEVTEVTQTAVSDDPTIRALQYVSWYKMTDTAKGFADVSSMLGYMSPDKAAFFTDLHDSMFGPCGSYGDKSYLTDDWYNGFLPGASNVGYLTDPNLSYEEKVFIGGLAIVDTIEVASIVKGAASLGSKGIVKLGGLFGKEAGEELVEHADDVVKVVSKTDDITFDIEHAFREGRITAGSQDEVVTAVQKEIKSGNINYQYSLEGGRKFYTGSTIVNGETVSFRATKNADGVYNVGTIFQGVDTRF